MSDLDTRIEGSPSSIESAATWLRDTLATALDSTAGSMTSGRSTAQTSWKASAGEAFASTIETGISEVDDLEGSARAMATDLEEFAHSLRTCQSDMSTARTEASAEGVVVDGWTIVDPGAGPAFPSGTGYGTPEEVAVYERELAAYRAHAALELAFLGAKVEVERVDRKYDTACTKLTDAYTVNEHASWMVTVAQMVGESGAGAAKGAMEGKVSKLVDKASELLDEAKAAVAAIAANPDKYVKRHFIFWRKLDQAKLDADVLAVQGKFDEASKLLDQAGRIEVGRVGQTFRVAGKILGPLGIGLGVFNDWQEGETTEQIIVSQGASAAVGAGVGWAAGVGSAAATGALIGSVVPGAGTVVGAVVGTVIGAGIALFADGAIDSLFENGPDVGKALEEGWESVTDSVDAIGDFVGGWFN